MEFSINENTFLFHSMLTFFHVLPTWYGTERFFPPNPVWVRSIRVLSKKGSTSTLRIDSLPGDIFFWLIVCGGEDMRLVRDSIVYFFYMSFSIHIHSFISILLHMHSFLQIVHPSHWHSLLFSIRRVGRIQVSWTRQIDHVDKIQQKYTTTTMIRFLKGTDHL